MLNKVSNFSSSQQIKTNVKLYHVIKIFQYNIKTWKLPSKL